MLCRNHVSCKTWFSSISLFIHLPYHFFLDDNLFNAMNTILIIGLGMPLPAVRLHAYTLLTCSHLVSLPCFSVKKVQVVRGRHMLSSRKLPSSAKTGGGACSAWLLGASSRDGSEDLACNR